MHPALRTEPARRYLGNMQQTVTAHANQLCSVPRQKISRRLPDSCGMCQFSKTHGTPLPLVSQRPTQSKKADRKRRYKLDVLRRKRIEGRTHIGQIERYQVNNRQEQRYLSAKKAPTAKSRRPRELSRTQPVLSKWKRCRGRQSKKGKHHGEEEEIPGFPRPLRKRHA